MNPLKTAVRSQTISFFLVSCLFLFAGATVPIDAKIVFCVDGDIFVMDEDGSRRRRLTKTRRQKTVIPAGRRMARKSLLPDHGQDGDTNHSGDVPHERRRH